MSKKKSSDFNEMCTAWCGCGGSLPFANILSGSYFFENRTAASYAHTTNFLSHLSLRSSGRVLQRDVIIALGTFFEHNVSCTRV